MTIAIECDVLDILRESENRTYIWALLIGIDSLCVRFSLTMPKTIKSLHGILRECIVVMHLSFVTKVLTLNPGE